ncbi:hypothetical protein R1sor_014130 [Riccia sorocarpa]|uniref:Uncharacterized protein n=1 Tax=Riccia sorocarpa TaxID=122646 RepID=A0ABD3HCP6_9MARC
MKSYADAAKTSSSDAGLQESSFKSALTTIEVNLQSQLKTVEAKSGEVAGHVASVGRELQALRQEVEKQSTRGETPQSAPELSRFMDSVDSRLRSYAEVARVTQASLFQDQEREKADREARRLNIRIVGLEESDTEDTKEVITTFFRDDLQVRTEEIESAIRIGRRDRGTRAILALNEAVLEGGRELWQKADITGLSETWTWKEGAANIPGFTHLTSVWNRKQSRYGRGFAGLERSKGGSYRRRVLYLGSAKITVFGTGVR